MNAVTAPVISQPFVDVPSRVDAERLPGHAYVALLALACLPIGIIWDISWHISIGRDTFWTPAHIVIQVGGVIPALLFAIQAFRTTFYGTPDSRAATVSMFGARAPLGAWVTMWGSLAMLTSAPFDDWWHNTYGLDVKIISPPHAMLGIGMLGVAFGVLLFLLSLQNRLTGAAQQRAALLFTLAVGLIVTEKSVFLTEYTWANLQHGTLFYKAIALQFPVLFVIAARASKMRWAATISAAVYTVIVLAMIWILPLFPAQAKLAPIYNPVTHMVPPAFPILLIIPAFAIDCLFHLFGLKTNTGAERLSRRVLKNLLLLAASSVAFIGLSLAVQWFFSKFLLSPAAENWFFSGNRHWPYYVRLRDWQHQFWSTDPTRSDFDPLRLAGILWALLFAAVTGGIGMLLGTWMVKVKR